MILGLVVVGVVFVLLNLFLGKGPSDVRVIASPSSTPVSVGTDYPVELLSPCAPTVDFDGSFWGPDGGWRLRQPAEPATVRLHDAEHAVLMTAAGQRIGLVRVDGPLRLSACRSPGP